MATKQGQRIPTIDQVVQLFARPGQAEVSFTQDHLDGLRMNQGTRAGNAATITAVLYPQLPEQKAYAARETVALPPLLPVAKKSSEKHAARHDLPFALPAQEIVQRLQTLLQQQKALDYIKWTDNFTVEYCYWLDWTLYEVKIQLFRAAADDTAKIILRIGGNAGVENRRFLAEGIPAVTPQMLPQVNRYHLPPPIPERDDPEEKAPANWQVLIQQCSGSEAQTTTPEDIQFALMCFPASRAILTANVSEVMRLFVTFFRESSEVTNMQKAASLHLLSQLVSVAQFRQEARQNREFLQLLANFQKTPDSRHIVGYSKLYLGQILTSKGGSLPAKL